MGTLRWVYYFYILKTYIQQNPESINGDNVTWCFRIQLCHEPAVVSVVLCYTQEVLYIRLLKNIYDLMACEFFVVGWGFKNRKTIKEQNIFLTYIILLWIFGHMIYHLISQMCWAEVSFVNTKLSKNRSIQTILLS